MLSSPGGEAGRNAAFCAGRDKRTPACLNSPLAAGLILVNGPIPERPQPPADGRRARLLGDFGGSFGDLGTFLPHVLGAITVAGLAPQGILAGFGLFLIGAGAFYAIPIAVQPMKAISAVLLTEGMSAEEIAAAGLMIGVILVILAATGLMERLARAVPQSVSTGLQLGLGLSMAVLGLGLMGDGPVLGLAMLALLLLLARLRHFPAVPLALALVIGLGLWRDGAGLPAGVEWQIGLPALVLPGAGAFLEGFKLGVLPQLPLTVTNAVIVTAALARELYPERAARVSERNLAFSTGLGNLLLCPLGALPMCHGAGGLQAQHRFGARTGLAPVVLGVLLLVAGLTIANVGALLALIPSAAVGALLVIAGADLALSRRLFDARPVCWPAIGITAGLVLLANPAAALAAGWAIEALRRPLGRVRGASD